MTCSSQRQLLLLDGLLFKVLDLIYFVTELTLSPAGLCVCMCTNLILETDILTLDVAIQAASSCVKLHDESIAIVMAVWAFKNGSVCFTNKIFFSVFV